MFRDYRAKSLEDVYLEDIPHILHPNFAQQYLAYSALPNRIMTSWDLPEGYELFVSKYRQFHYQFAYMAYQDALNDVKSGKVVLLRKQETGYTTTRVLTFSGDLEYDLPLLVRSRLSYLISHQLKRPVYYVRRSAPQQHAQSAKTINSKAAGRLLGAFITTISRALERPLRISAAKHQMVTIRLWITRGYSSLERLLLLA